MTNFFDRIFMTDLIACQSNNDIYNEPRHCQIKVPTPQKFPQLLNYIIRLRYGNERIDKTVTSDSARTLIIRIKLVERARSRFTIRSNGKMTKGKRIRGAVARRSKRISLSAPRKHLAVYFTIGTPNTYVRLSLV